MIRIAAALSMIFLLAAAPVFALGGDGGTLATCYPGGFNQILTGIKPYIVSCSQYTKLGLCFHKGRPYANHVMFWLPVYAIEVTGHAGTTVLPKSPGVFTSPESLVSKVRPGSMVQGEAGDDQVMTRYREVHMYEFSKEDVAKILAGHPALACMMRTGSSCRGATVFKSESYAAWRLGKDPGGMLKAAEEVTHVGTWGSLYPRTGWSIHPSSVTNSLLLSFRAQDLASDTSLVSRGRLFLDKYEFGGPLPGACYPIGSPAMLQEKGVNRPGCADRMVIIYWRMYVTCCDFGIM